MKPTLILIVFLTLTGQVEARTIKADKQVHAWIVDRDAAKKLYENPSIDGATKRQQQERLEGDNAKIRHWKQDHKVPNGAKYSKFWHHWTVNP